MLVLLFVGLLLGVPQDFGLDPHFFQHPLDYAAAVDVKGDTVFSISYGLAPSSRVCVGSYELGDEDFSNPLEQRCFTPEKDASISLFVWRGKNLKDLGSLLVTIYHKDGSAPTVMALVYKES